MFSRSVNLAAGRYNLILLYNYVLSPRIASGDRGSDRMIAICARLVAGWRAPPAKARDEQRALGQALPFARDIQTAILIGLYTSDHAASGDDAPQVAARPAPHAVGAGIGNGFNSRDFELLGLRQALGPAHRLLLRGWRVIS